VAVSQGDASVPGFSAGAASNTTVTAEVLSAAAGVPTVFSLSTDTTSYHKQYVSLGNDTVGAGAPDLDLELPPVDTTSASGYLGMDIAILDLGSNLAPDSGPKNSERTTFLVGWSADPIQYTVGTLTNTGGNYINVIYLDVTGLPGGPPQIDRVYLVDASGTNPPQRGSIDVDGALRLTGAPPVATQVATWGAVKATYR